MIRLGAIIYITSFCSQGLKSRGVIQPIRCVLQEHRILCIDHPDLLIIFARISPCFLYSERLKEVWHRSWPSILALATALNPGGVGRRENMVNNSIK